MIVGSISLRILCFVGDLGGCFTYRVQIPFYELKQFGVEYDAYPFVPRNPNMPEMAVLINMIREYDLVIIQRSYLFDFVSRIRTACDFLGKPLVFETDDDYFNLIPSNPAYYGMIPEDVLKRVKDDKKELERTRLMFLEGYKALLELPDLITVSTEELKRTIYPYNKNVVVLQNNVVRTSQWRDYTPQEEQMIEDGKVQIRPRHQMWMVPCYHTDPKTKEKVQDVRIGYSGTPSHRIEDFKTVEYYWGKLIDRYEKSAWFVYIGDDYFYKIHEDVRKRRGIELKRSFMLPQCAYDLYNYHLRNLDIGIAPLAPTVFNMSKSDIKAVELGAWGIPCVLPDYITYTRNWKNGENCLTYRNGGEFLQCMELLMSDAKLRVRLGTNALKYVNENRLEKQHSSSRYHVYKDLLDNSYPLKVFTPREETNVQSTREPVSCA